MIKPRKLQKCLLILFLALTFMPKMGNSEGLIRSVWGCAIPCEVKDSHEPLTGIQISYCSTSAQSLAMIQSVSAVCQAKNKRLDAVAVRSSINAVASCSSSSNPCPKEGLTKVGFTCSYLCPSEDAVIHKFTACAATGDEAWSFATLVCKDALLPPAYSVARSQNCFPDGQTPCE